MQFRILIVGASGTVGRAIDAELGDRHHIIRASRSGDVTLDITDTASIERALDTVGELDAVVSAVR